MSETKHIQIRYFNYSLPDERIAKFPLPQRDSSKLLLYNKGKVSEDTFRNLPQHLPERALMVFNKARGCCSPDGFVVSLVFHVSFIIYKAHTNV